MEEIINNIVKLPLAAKLGIVAGIIVALCAVNFFLFPGIDDIRTKTKRQQAKLAKLETDLEKKRAIANNLPQYRRDLEVLEQQLKEALTEMPEEVQMDNLIAQLADLAHKAGLQLTSITPVKETKEGGFYYRIPIKMEVNGNYHEIAVFLDSLSKLKRIVNVNNLQLGQAKDESNKIVLRSTYLATTFRFDPTVKKADGDGKKSRRRGR